MAELQIDLNVSFEFDKMTESGAALEPLTGPGCAFTRKKSTSYIGSACNTLYTVFFWRFDTRPPIVQVQLAIVLVFLACIYGAQDQAHMEMPVILFGTQVQSG